MSSRRWWRWLLAAAAALLVFNLGVSLLLATSRLRQALSARLEASFGRSIEVSRFDWNLLGGLRVEANYFTVGEDPRFGHEYFLRGERLTAGLRWSALLRGRLEFGAIRLDGASVNVVRDGAGKWNVEAWYRPGAAAAGDAAASPALRVENIHIENGRLNFKQGPDKLPFALAGLAGSLVRESDGIWRVDLSARPIHAGVIVQDPGQIDVTGRIGGKEAGRGAADLRIAWRESPLSDVLRLVRGHDYGMRGRVLIELRARHAAPEASTDHPWQLAAAARFSGLHRWDFAPRPGDPALNFLAAGSWWPEASRVEVTEGSIEGPRSSARFSGQAVWGAAKPLRFSGKLFSNGLDLGELVDWLRAFRPGVSDALRVEGHAALDLRFSGLPLRFEAGTIASGGARARRGQASLLLQVEPWVTRIERANARFGPADVQLLPDTARDKNSRNRGPEAAISGKMNFSPPWNWEISVSGQTAQVEELLAAARAAGWQQPTGWRLLDSLVRRSARRPPGAQTYRFAGAFGGPVGNPK